MDEQRVVWRVNINGLSLYQYVNIYKLYFKASYGKRINK